MGNAEQLGRSCPRNYMVAAFPGGYLDTDNLEALESLDSDLRAALAEFGAQAIAYDKEATAYIKNGATTSPRTEPVMLHRWKGACYGEVPAHTDQQRGFDTVGLKIIVRGRGCIQDTIRDILNTDPDEGSTQECETYSFSCKNPGVENWQ